MSFPFCTCSRLRISNATTITSLFGRLSVAPITQTRGFKGTREATPLSKIRVENVDDSLMPPYPYGPRKFYKQADSGLYGGKVVMYGNKISKGRNKGKTRRTWNPHVKLADLESKALQQVITVKVTYACLRTINKCGGLDEYLLGDKPARIKELGLYGWHLRWKVMNTPLMKIKYAAERANLGLPHRMEPVVPFDMAWKDPEYRQKAMAEQREAWEELAKADARFRKHVAKKWQPKDQTRYPGRRAVIPDFMIKAASLTDAFSPTKEA